LAKAGDNPSPEEMRGVLETLNGVDEKRALHESPELANVAGPYADFAATWSMRILHRLGWKQAKAADTVAAIRQQLETHFDAEQSRRLNKFLMPGVFSISLRTARLNP